MRLNHPLTLLSLLSPLTLAQSNYPNQTGPFNLVLTSTTNSTLNGTLLNACHSGAAIESLCLLAGTTATDSFAQFYLNSTTQTTPSTSIITWPLVGSGFTESEPLIFEYSPTSNVALPLLFPSDEDAQPVQVDATTGEVGIALVVDDTVTPPKSVTPTDAGYPSVYRWYVCVTYSGGYTYTTLAWKLGGDAIQPQNPSCQAVRLFLQGAPPAAPTYPTRSSKMRRGRVARSG